MERETFFPAKQKEREKPAKSDKYINIIKIYAASLLPLPLPCALLFLPHSPLDTTRSWSCFWLLHASSLQNFSLASELSRLRKQEEENGAQEACQAGEGPPGTAGQQPEERYSMCEPFLWSVLSFSISLLLF